MPRLAANLSFLFLEHDFLDRFAAARRAGFRAVEFHFPYAHEIGRIAEALARSGLEAVLFNMPAGDWAQGDRGIAADPGRVGEFQAGVGRAIEYAGALGVPRLNCLAGIPPAGVTRDQAHATLVANLRFAARALADSGLTLVAEAINTRTVPGFFLATLPQFLAVQREVGATNLLLQYDCFHMQIMGGDLAHGLAAHLAAIGHVQVADVPDRHEPGTGELNFPFLFDHLDRIGYSGWVAAEYVPSRRTEDTLAWARPWLHAAGAAA
jgi:hydroxypyruvate isomerase